MCGGANGASPKPKQSIMTMDQGTLSISLMRCIRVVCCRVNSFFCGGAKNLLSVAGAFPVFEQVVEQGFLGIGQGAELHGATPGTPIVFGGAVT